MGAEYALMFHGLSLMNGEELNAVTNLLGLKAPLPTEDEAREKITGWLARTVKCKGQSADALERAVLEWTGQALGLHFDASLSTDDLERLIRLKIAEDAAEYLSPSWSLVCALIASGKKEAIPDKLALMTQAVSVAIPSRAALNQKRQEWESLCQRWSKEDPRPELEPLVATVASRSQLGKECLTLGLALSLLDGQIPFPTERLYKELADQFGMNSTEIERLQKRVNDLYWQHHNAANPAGTRKGDGPDVITEAARQTVYGAGALEALATEARASLISSLELEPRSGWSRMVGGLSGMNPFFSNKLKEPAEAVLARIVYHTILKQHAAVAPEIVLDTPAAPKPAAPAPQAKPAGPPPPPLPPQSSQSITSVPEVSSGAPAVRLSMDPTPAAAPPAPAAFVPPPAASSPAPSGFALPPAPELSPAPAQEVAPPGGSAPATPAAPAAFALPSADSTASPPPFVPPGSAPAGGANVLDEGAPLPTPKKDVAKPPTTRSIKLDL